MKNQKTFDIIRFVNNLEKKNLENKSSIFWECYMSNLLANNNYQVAFRIEVTKSNDEEKNEEKNEYPAIFMRSFFSADFAIILMTSFCLLLEGYMHTRIIFFSGAGGLGAVGDCRLGIGNLPQG